MVNILVPTDFSDLSKVAIRYAVKLANKIDANITLLHVLNAIQPTRASMRFRIQALERELMQIAKEDMDSLVNEFGGQIKTDHTLKTRIVKGSSYKDTVKQEAKKLRSGLIIMGTKGASGLKKYVMGTNTASVIDVSHVPVLVIPELAQFKNFKHVVFATDLNRTDKELKILIPYLEKFNSRVHVIHVTSKLTQVSALEKRLEAIVAKTPYKNLNIRVMVNKNIDEAIDHYVSTAKADLLTTFTHEHSFYDKLFDRSITRKIAFQSKVPLLAFKQK